MGGPHFPWKWPIFDASAPGRHQSLLALLNRRAGSAGGQGTGRGGYPAAPERTHNSGWAELGRQNTISGWLNPEALKPTGRALGSDHHGRESVAPLSVRTTRNRRTRTRMSGLSRRSINEGGWCGRREVNPPADPIRRRRSHLLIRLFDSGQCLLDYGPVRLPRIRIAVTSPAAISV
jgi:hypothetical protein